MDIAVPMTLRHFPRPTGPWSRHVSAVLQQRALGRPKSLPFDRFDDDAQYAWFLLNCASYQGWDGVADDVEWDPHVLALRRRFERWFLDEMRRRCTDGPVEPREAVRHALAPSGTPGIAAYLEHRGTALQVRESLLLRVPYQHQEADPHTWLVPRLRGDVKRALCDIQAGEYGVGHTRTHAELFLAAVAGSGEPATSGVYPLLPGAAFATFNFLTAAGLNRSLRGAAIGQLALFEMDSVDPNQKMVHACERLGFSDDVTEFFRVHVLADAEHEVIAARAFLDEYPLDEPDQVDNLLFGIRVQSYIDGVLAEHAVGAWSAGRSALRSPSTAFTARPAA